MPTRCLRATRTRASRSPRRTPSSSGCAPRPSRRERAGVVVGPGRVRRALRARRRAAAGRLDGRRGDEARPRAPGRAAARRRARPRRALRERRADDRAPSRSSSSTTSRPTRSTSTTSRRSSRAPRRSAARRAARCSAARPRRCRASTATGELDFAGTCVGLVTRDRLVDGSRVAAGDVVLGFPSSGLHANGFSLVRRLIGDGEFDADLLLEPTRLYLDDVRRLRTSADVRALAHITGGGIPGNLARVLPAGLGARIDPGSWERPAVFALARRPGRGRGGAAARLQPRDRLLRGRPGLGRGGPGVAGDRPRRGGPRRRRLRRLTVDEHGAFLARIRAQTRAPSGDTMMAVGGGLGPLVTRARLA